MCEMMLNRRQFGCRVGLGAGWALAAMPARPVEAACGDVKPNEAKSDEANSDEAKSPQLDELSEAELLLALCRKRYADPRLTDDVAQRILNDLRGDLSRGRILSAWPLKNSDEPVFVFRAYRADGVGSAR